jgi:hypothetical protein
MPMGPLQRKLAAPALTTATFGRERSIAGVDLAAPHAVGYDVELVEQKAADRAEAGFHAGIE